MQREKINAREISDAEVVSGTAQTPPVVRPAPGMYAKGTVVSIIGSNLRGDVIGYHLSEDGTALTYMIAFKMNGEDHHRSFTHEQLMEVVNE